MYITGIRGDLNIVVKVELFGDVNEFREASTGVQFIASEDLGFIMHEEK